VCWLFRSPTTVIGSVSLHGDLPITQRRSAGARVWMDGHRDRCEAWPRVWRQAPSIGGPLAHSRATPSRIRAVVRPGSPAARAWAAAGEVASSGRAALEPGLPLRALVEHGGDVVA